MYIYIYTYIYIYICVCVYIYIYIHTYTYTYIYIYACMHIYIYACMYTCSLRRLLVERAMIFDLRMMLYHIDVVKRLRLNLYIYIRTYVLYIYI